MAKISSNVLVSGLSGMLGGTLVFKMLRGKTYVASRPRPARSESEQQRQNRAKFKAAAQRARIILLNPEKKELYKAEAKRLGLPNAYTAVVAELMQK
jgi:hypothetical protein